MDVDVPLPPSASGNYQIRVKVKSLPPSASGTMTTTSDEQPRVYQCKYCAFNSHWPKDVARHEQQKHPNYSSVEQDEQVDTSNGLSSLLIDDDEDDAYALRFLSLSL
jgi:hypothetical protein